MPKKKLKVLAIFIFIFVLLIAIPGIVKYSPFIFQLLFSKGIDVKKTDGEINILLLGIGGGSHDGPDLTDTMIFASINPENNKVNLISIPRDLWIPDLKKKINAVYATGEEKKKGEGLKFAENVVGKIMNKKIDYGIRLDFDGFVKAVDAMGGLDIKVDNTFDDFEYPIEGKEIDPCGHKEDELVTLATASSQLEAFSCRYKHLRFDKGLTHMDGKTALTYVRSRHAQGEEGTDFARSKRQEKVISAFKEKALTLQTLLNPGKVLTLYSLLKNSIDTDVPEDQFDDFVRLAQKMKGVKIQSFVLDYGDPVKNIPGLLINPISDETYQYQWVLVPRIGNGNFSEIQKYVECGITIGNCVIGQTQVEDVFEKVKK